MAAISTKTDGQQTTMTKGKALSAGGICLLITQILLFIFWGMFVTTDKNAHTSTSMLCNQMKWCQGDATKCEAATGNTCKDTAGADCTGTTCTNSLALCGACTAPNAGSCVFVKMSGDSTTTDIEWSANEKADQLPKGLQLTFLEEIGAYSEGETCNWKNTAGDQVVFDQSVLPGATNSSDGFVKFQEKLTEIGEYNWSQQINSLNAPHALVLLLLFLPMRSITSVGAGTAARFLVTLLMSWQMSVFWDMLWRGAFLGFFTPVATGSAMLRYESVAWEVVVSLIVAFGAFSEYSLSLMQLMTFASVHAFFGTMLHEALYLGIQVVDFWGCCTVHIFGALFGLLAAKMFGTKANENEEVEPSNLGAMWSLFVVCLSMFLMLDGSASLLNLYVVGPALAGAYLGHQVLGYAKYFSLYDVQRAVIAAVVVNSVADANWSELFIPAWLAIMGFVAGFLSSCGRFTIGKMFKNFGLYDRSGVVTLHLVIGLLAVLFALFTLVIPMNFQSYGSWPADVCGVHVDEITETAPVIPCQELDTTTQLGKCSISWIGGGNSALAPAVAFNTDNTARDAAQNAGGFTSGLKTEWTTPQNCLTTKLITGSNGIVNLSSMADQYHPFVAMLRSYPDGHIGQAPQNTACNDRYGNWNCYPLAHHYTETYAGVSVNSFSRGWSRGLGGQAGVQFAAALLAIAYALVAGPLVGFVLGMLGRCDKTEDVSSAAAGAGLAGKMADNDQDESNNSALSPPLVEQGALSEAARADIYTAVQVPVPEQQSPVDAVV